MGMSRVTPFIRKVEGPLDSAIQPVKFHKTTLVDGALAGVPAKKFTPAAMSKLLEQSWPGNVRELENCIERAVALSDGAVVDEREILDAKKIERHKETVGIFSKLMTLEEIEKCYILYVLAHTGAQKDKAAKILGIDRKTLYRREVAYGLSQPTEEANLL